MKRYHHYLTLVFVLFLTIFSFFHMFRIVEASKFIIQIVFQNLLPSLLPFMVLISLCLNLGLLDIFSYIIQYPFSFLFQLTPMMSSLYFISFFCGYPTNVKSMKEAYELGYISIDEFNHLLKIAHFSSFSFIFVSLHTSQSLLIYICHILPSLLYAFFYKHETQPLSLSQVLSRLHQPHISFVPAFKKSILSSLYAFVFILGYMLIFQYLSLFLTEHFHIIYLTGFLEFSSGALKIIYESDALPFICAYLSFSGISVLMQVDNLLEGIDYDCKGYILFRIYHAIFSFLLCLILM